MSKDKTTHSDKELPDFCYLQVSIAGQVLPRPIVIRLHKEACPKTCRNFAALCTNDERTRPQKPIATYCGSHFHRIVPNFMCQAGDFERFDGTGGYSPIYHGGRFNDENLTGKHDKEGVVSMANAGKNTNKSQFFITLKATPHLDGKHVVFGQVVSGMESVHVMTTVEREGDRPVPLQRIVISDCGVGMGDKEKEAHGQKDKDESDGKRSKKKRKKHSKSKRDDGSRHRDRKKRRKHHSSHREDDSDSDSSSYSSSSVSSNDNRRDGSHSRHRRRHRSRSEDRHGRKKHSSHHRKRSRSSKRKGHGSSDSCSSSDYSRSDHRDYRRDHERRRKKKHKSRR